MRIGGGTGKFEVDGLIKVGLSEPSVEHSRLDMQIVHCVFDGSAEGENPVEESFVLGSAEGVLEI